MDKVSIDVDGMKCGGCESLIEEKLMSENGVSEAKADHKSGQVKVCFDTRLIAIDEVKELIRAQGYRVKD